MKSPCKTCLTHSCSCKNQEDCVAENDVKHMFSPLSHMNKNGTVPDKRFQRRLQNVIYYSPLNVMKQSASTENKNLFSTPTKNYSVTISNPFELEVDSLHTSSFSPSVFSVTKNNSDENKPFRWSIEQLALLHPADIDETSQQEVCFKVDAEKEMKAQQAIDVFFSKNHIAPSPWTPPMKYTSFIPHLASTAYQSEIDPQISEETCSASDQDSHSKNVCTQTTLTIPPDLNLMALLGQFYTYQVKSKDTSDCSSNELDMSSTSFRRRKLFTNNDEDNDTDVSFSLPVNKEPNNNLPPKFETPDFKSSHWSIVTPFSDHCSSSPITPRNFSLSGNCPGISICSPDISPICTSAQSSIRRSQSSYHKSQVSLQGDASRELPVPHDVQEEALDTESNSVMMTSSSEFGAISSSYNVMPEPEKQSNSHMTAEERMSSNNSSSNQKDTGYLTGSINSTASVFLQQASSFMQVRATPVAELLEECAIAEENFSYSDNKNVSCSIDDSMMAVSQSDCLQLGNMPISFNMSWQPHKFSTPSKVQTQDTNEGCHSC